MMINWRVIVRYDKYAEKNPKSELHKQKNEISGKDVKGAAKKSKFSCLKKKKSDESLAINDNASVVTANVTNTELIPAKHMDEEDANNKEYIEIDKSVKIYNQPTTTGQLRSGRLIWQSKRLFGNKLWFEIYDLSWLGLAGIPHYDALPIVRNIRQDTIDNIPIIGNFDNEYIDKRVQREFDKNNTAYIDIKTHAPDTTYTYDQIFHPIVITRELYFYSYGRFYEAVLDGKETVWSNDVSFLYNLELESANKLSTMSISLFDYEGNVIEKKFKKGVELWEEIERKDFILEWSKFLKLVTLNLSDVCEFVSTNEYHLSDDSRKQRHRAYYGVFISSITDGDSEVFWSFDESTCEACIYVDTFIYADSRACDILIQDAESKYHTKSFLNVGGIWKSVSQSNSSAFRRLVEFEIKRVPDEGWTVDSRIPYGTIGMRMIYSPLPGFDIVKVNTINKGYVYKVSRDPYNRCINIIYSYTSNFGIMEIDVIRDDGTLRKVFLKRNPGTLRWMLTIPEIVIQVFRYIYDFDGTMDCWKERPVRIAPL
ncbi:hypothetical protein BdWA1_003230 [Babesia duncani]|uniref:Uncharacterized protein n=1 Tax=Babesia duncani TaxID=323732 RepID=A0AAD9PIL0_9APIC|nr:hypothetical protein BdWA1_003230 [Babesia duncani]